MASRPVGSFWPSARQTLLLRAALLEGDEGADAWAALRPELDLDRLEPGSSSLLPLVLARLQRAGIEDPLRPRLLGMYRRTWYANNLLVHRLADALESVRASGAETLVVGGWELPIRYYGDLGVRPLGELRLLARPAGRPRIAAALVAAGWTAGAQAGSETRLARGGDVCSITSSLLPEFADLRTGREPEDPWEGAVGLTVGRMRARTLAPADELLEVCLSGARVHDAPSVLWAADAVTVLRAGGVDWPRLVRQARRLRATLRLADALTFLRDELAADVPEAALDELRDAPVDARERLAHRAAASTWPLVGAPPQSLTRFLRLTADRSLGAAITQLPSFLQAEWAVDGRTGVLGSAATRGKARIARRASRASRL